MRALATGSAECVCGTVNYIVRCLEASLLSEVSARLDRAATQCGNAGVAATGDGSAAAGDGPAVAKLSKEFVQLAVTVNNIEVRAAHRIPYLEGCRAGCARACVCVRE